MGLDSGGEEPGEVYSLSVHNIETPYVSLRRVPKGFLSCAGSRCRLLYIVLILVVLSTAAGVQQFLGSPATGPPLTLRVRLRGGAAHARLQSNFGKNWRDRNDGSEVESLKATANTMALREPLRTADPSAPPITRLDVLRCSIEEWYPLFSKHTLKTKFIELSADFVDYMLADGLILLVCCEAPSAHCNDGGDDSWGDFSGARSVLCDLKMTSSWESTSR